MVLFQVASSYEEKEQQPAVEEEQQKDKKQKRKDEPKKKPNKLTKKIKLAKEEKRRLNNQFQNFRQVVKSINGTYYSFFVSAFGKKREHRRITSVVFELQLFKDFIDPDTTITLPFVVCTSTMTFNSYKDKLEPFIDFVMEEKGSTDAFICNIPDEYLKKHRILSCLSKPVYVQLKNGVFTFGYLPD